MPTQLRRFYGKGELHFLTFSCFNRLPLLMSDRVMNLFLAGLSRVRQEYGVRLVGYVLMPNHVHLLLGESQRGTLSTVLQMLKQRVSRKMRLWSSSVEAARSFWQPRFCDFNVYTRGKVIEKLNYMHANPVKNGWVGHPEEWPWSSWSFYYQDEKGLLLMDSWDAPGVEKA